MKKCPISVVGISVSDLCEDACGTLTKIDAADYKYNGKCFPSHQVRLVYNTENIHVGEVDEVPERQKNSTTPPPPALRQTDNGRLRKEETQGGYNYKSMPEDVMVEWDARRKELWLNQDHRFIRRHFIPDESFTLNSPKHRRIVDLYDSWYSTANTLDQLFTKTQPEPKKHDDKWDDNLLNYALNSLITVQIQSDPLMMEHIEKIEAK
jgi:hypothetical protein